MQIFKGHDGILVLLFSITAGFGYIVQDILFVLLIFLYQKHGFWHILEIFRNINTINCLNFTKETNMFGYLFWKKLNFPIAKIFIKTFLGKYQIFVHQCILRILSCRELFSLPRCQKPERGPDYPDLYQPCWKQEEMMMKVVMMIIFKIVIMIQKCGDFNEKTS